MAIRKEVRDKYKTKEWASCVAQAIKGRAGQEWSSKEVLETAKKLFEKKENENNLGSKFKS